jgi:hypothetical protein
MSKPRANFPFLGRYVEIIGTDESHFHGRLHAIDEDSLTITHGQLIGDFLQD